MPQCGEAGKIRHEMTSALECAGTKWLSGLHGSFSSLRQKLLAALWCCTTNVLPRGRWVCPGWRMRHAHKAG